MKPIPFQFALIVLAFFLLSACSSPVDSVSYPIPPAYPDAGSSVPPAVAYPLPGEPMTEFTPQPYPFPTKDQSPPGTPIVKGADPFPGWATYLNSNYDFAFRYPDAYLVEESPHQARLTRPGAELLVSFRGPEEAVELPHDLPYAGDLEPGAEVEFFDQGVLEIRHLVNGQVMAVEYAALNTTEQPDEIPGPSGMLFAIQLFSTQSDVPLPDELLEEARALLTSFEPWANN